MKRTVWTVLATFLATLVVVFIAVVVVVYSGAYNVAATEAHRGLTVRALDALQHNSVSARAGEITGQPPVDSAALAHGFDHFHAMCVQCHGAPGMDRGEIGKGITPEPPRLEEAAAEWTDAELFWITKHGIRLAGMPAFGPTHGDGEIWSIVGFVRLMEEMTEEEYAERVRALGQDGGEAEGGHSHAPGTPEHGH